LGLDTGCLLKRVELGDKMYAPAVEAYLKATLTLTLTL